MRAPGSRELLDRWASHPWMVGDPTIPGRVLGRRVRLMTVVAVVAANAVGTAVVLAFALFVLPKPDGLPESASLWNLALAVAYLLVAVAVGIRWGRRAVEGGPDGTAAWLYDERRPSARQQRRALRGPLRIMGVHMALWGLAVVCFTALDATFDPLLALGVGLTVALGGVTTSAAAYVLGELALRPVAARALAGGVVERRGVPGVGARWLLAWALGTGVPVLGLALVGIVALTPAPIDRTTLAVTTVALTGTALVVGATVSALSAYATVHPIASIRRGLARVREGDLDVELAVWDSTEMGLLQAGFNEMVAGLRERERIRDLFGRQVGEDVARRAMATDGAPLAGEVCEVAVLFADVAGSTALAASRPPEEVVALLNRLFADAVDVVERHGGWIDKFQGDAALAVFGAPAQLDDAAGAALRAAEELDRRLRERVPELEVGIGVAAGPVVAGPVGAERRYEYTVIGDPVNEAARLTELAKSRSARVLASGATVERAGGPAAARWHVGEAVTLRGRDRPTTLAHPGGAITRGRG